MNVVACQWNSLTGYMPSIWMSVLFGVLLAAMAVGCYVLGRLSR